jgi:hypothetical protein
MNIYLIIYVIVSIAVVAGGTMKLYDTNTIGALLFFVGSGFVCGLYGLRWFGSAKSLLSQTPVEWPPSMNTCPDYLTYFEVMDGVAKRKTCIDTIGVSKNGQVKVFPSQGNPPQYSADSPYYFSIDTTQTDPIKIKMEQCNNAILRGLTWEGITNGEACIDPSGGTRAPSDPNSKSCPQ